jgi:hypothetical protein
MDDWDIMEERKEIVEQDQYVLNKIGVTLQKMATKI